MANAPVARNPLLDLADRHSLKKPGFVGSVAGGVGRGLKFGARELEKYLVNPVLSDTVRSMFNANPIRRGNNTSATAYQKPEMLGRSQAVMLNKIYQVTVQNERHLRSLNVLVGLTKQTNSLLKNMVQPSSIRPSNKELNPFEVPKAANTNNVFANDNSGDEKSGIFSSLFSAISSAAIGPVLLKGLKKVLSKTITKIPFIGPLIGVMLNLPGAIETFEKEGLGAAFVDLISSTVEDISFGLIDKEKFKNYFIKGFQSLYDGVLSVGQKVAQMFTDVADMIDSLLKKIKIGPIRIPDILGGGTIEWDPFKDGLKIDTPPPASAEPVGQGDQGGGGSPYVGPLNTVAYADQLAARQDATDPKRDSNIEVTGKWEGRQQGDIITPEMLRNETGVGQEEYLKILKMFIDSGQARLTNKPANVQPKIEMRPPELPDSTAQPGELGSRRIRVPEPYVPLPRRSLFSSAATSERAESFVRQSESRGSQQQSVPVIINAPVTNVTGAQSGGGSTTSNVRTPMGSATLQNTWEIRAAQGTLVGVP